ncbi:uncharacterized protein LOC112564949 [Pomacea canaliculata]|uniref:uncharacterized protein LOC112564949 n=1 Tax=Pomacea canaliculata TaxID=400727 RepID=UPI000D734A24|nr:uncharacterized protein LOC112564949 [Pomacea canaliculata]
MNLMRGKSDNSSKAQNNSSDNATVGTHNNGGNDSQTISTQQHSQVCSVPVDLENYECGDDPWLLRYFRSGMTAEGIADMLFDMSIVRELQQKCPPGQWCLGDQLAALAFRADSFYRGAFVWDEFWDCSLEVIKKRLMCDDRHLRFLLDAATLLVELIEWQSLPSYQRQRARPCFAQTLAALHVTYAAFLDNRTSVRDSSTCSGYSFEMTNTYLCTFNACNATFLEAVDALLAIKEFGWWEETADRVEEVKAGCPGTGADCGPVNTLIMLLADEAFNPESWDDDDDDDFYDDEDYYDDDEYDYFDYDDYYDDEDYYDEDYEDDDDNDDDDDDEKNDRGKVEGDSTKPTFNENLDERYKTNHFPAESFITSEESEDMQSSSDAEDKSLMTALAVATGVGALFMVAALLVFWQRRRRARSFFYYRDNYGKMYKDDAHLLSNSDE